MRFARASALGPLGYVERIMSAGLVKLLGPPLAPRLSHRHLRLATANFQKKARSDARHRSACRSLLERWADYDPQTIKIRENEQRGRNGVWFDGYRRSMPWSDRQAACRD